MRLVLVVFLVVGCAAQAQEPLYIGLAADTSGRVFELVELRSELHPSFPGGISRMSDFIDSAIVYPEKELRQRITGWVYIRFIVEPDGSLSTFQELSGVPDGPGLTEEAFRVFQHMPKWVPGVSGGRRVRTAYTTSVWFSSRRLRNSKRK